MVSLGLNEWIPDQKSVLWLPGQDSNSANLIKYSLFLIKKYDNSDEGDIRMTWHSRVWYGWLQGKWIWLIKIITLTYLKVTSIACSTSFYTMCFFEYEKHTRATLISLLKRLIAAYQHQKKRCLYYCVTQSIECGCGLPQVKSVSSRSGCHNTAK